MEENKMSKGKEILAILLLTLVIGTGTLAWIVWSSKDNTKMNVTIGDLADVSFKSGNDINISNLSPSFYYDDGALTEFSIRKKKGLTTELNTNIYLDITSISDELKNDNFKYVLLSSSDGNTYNEVISSSFKDASVGKLSIVTDSPLTDGKTYYRFYIWIDGNNENNETMQGKSLKGTLNVEVSTPKGDATTKIEALDDGSTGDSGSGVYKVSHSAIAASNSATGGEIQAVTDYRYYGPNPNNYILLPDMNTTESRCMINDKELYNPSEGEWPANFDCENEVVYKLDEGSSVILYIPTSTFEIVAPAGSMTWNEKRSKCLYNGSSINTMYIGNIDENVCTQMSVINIQGNTKSAIITKMNDKPHKLNVKNGLYRIIGSIYEEKENTNRIKVIKATPLTDGTTSAFSWDYKVNNGNGSSDNIWATITSGNYSNSLTSGASIMKLLNSGLWWNGTSGSYYNGSTTATTVNFINYKLSDKAKSYITTSRYYLGGSYDSKTMVGMYEEERGTNRYDENRPLYWDGIVGLMYPSDYGYAAGNTCATGINPYKYLGECSNKSWLYKTGVNQWLMSPNAGSFVHYVFDVGRVGIISSSDIAFAVSPVFYLSSSASISDGDGTLNNPYILK